MVRFNPDYRLLLTTTINVYTKGHIQALREQAGKLSDVADYGNHRSETQERARVVTAHGAAVAIHHSVPTKDWTAQEQAQ